MRILIVTLRVRKRTGTEIVTRDFVKAFREAGHDVAVLTETFGAIADEVRGMGAHVCTAIDQLPFPPEIAHFNHTVFVKPVFEKFPGCAGVFQHHSPGESVNDAVRNPGFRFRFGISPLACRQIRLTTGGPDDGWLGNHVDLEQLTRIAQPKQRPTRWLVICQKKRCLKQLAILARLAWRHGAWLTAVGPRVFRRIQNIPDAAGRYDLVFASARCALEAAVAGAGVVVSDYRGVGGFLTRNNVHAMWQSNFGGETFSGPLSLKSLERAINSYNADAAVETGEFLRQHANLDSGLEQLERIYANALARRCA